LLGSGTGAGQYGTTPSVTLIGITVGSQEFVKIAGADTTLRTLRR
jgi:hypothetical protein